MAKSFIKALCVAVAATGVVLSAGCSSCCGDCSDKPKECSTKKCDSDKK
ncbi:MAG: hypothetical protein MK132_05915 [Lentisphaerales bacterium]|nr:hypothetical protein [Lentisphaerales bacterium]